MMCEIVTITTVSNTVRFMTRIAYKALTLKT